MVALLMIFGGFPVVPGVLGMLMVGFLGSFWVRSEVVSSATEINRALMDMFYWIDHHIWTGGETFWTFANWFQVPTYETNGFIIFLTFAYFALEILIFSIIMIGGALKGKPTPKIKQRF